MPVRVKTPTTGARSDSGKKPVCVAGLGLRVFCEEVLRIIFKRRGEERTGGWRNCIMMSFEI